MRLDDLDPSSNVDDLGRGGSGGGGGGLGLLGFLPLLLSRGKMGCGTIAILGIVVVAYLLFSGGLGGGGTQPAREGGTTAAGGANGVPCDTADELFACRVLALTERTWEQVFQQAGARYQPPRLRFYQQDGQSGCGQAMAAMGPFYCPADNGIYLDTTFFQELDQQFGAAGDFAQAYVIAHEVGHHIQTIDGTADRVSEAQARVGEAEGNALQVRMELQADCYAGVWAALNRDRLEPGDVAEGLRAASAIGDDTLARSAGQRPVPESFTHGTAEQRSRWLQRGLTTGDPAACDTFTGAV